MLKKLERCLNESDGCARYQVLVVLSPRFIQPVNLGLRGFILGEVRKRGEVLERE